VVRALSGGKPPRSRRTVVPARDLPSRVGFYVAEQGIQPEEGDAHLSSSVATAARDELQHGFPGGIVVDGDQLYWSQEGPASRSTAR